jgi:hypothetical protein
MDAIQKQIMIRYGGDRYEGKIVCRNCGQGLQDIEYDQHVEFDDSGRPVVAASVLTDEQMEEPDETAWKKSTSLLAQPITFASEKQQILAEIATTILERGGILVPPELLRQIVRFADLFVNLRAPDQRQYDAQRAKAMASASTKFGKLPTYDALVDRLRVPAVICLITIFLQTADPVIPVNNPFPLCEFSRSGCPLSLKQNWEKPTALNYVACVVAFIQRDSAPWMNLQWSAISSGDAKKTRLTMVMKECLSTMNIMLGDDPKFGSLSFTPELLSILEVARDDKEGMEKRSLVSRTDQLDTIFRPDPFPTKMGAPAIERNPIPAIEAALSKDESIIPLIGGVAHAIKQQSLAIISALHERANEDEKNPKPQLDSTCCPLTLKELDVPVGKGSEPLRRAQRLLRNSQVYTPHTGTHLWPVFDTPEPAEIVPRMDETVFFKLFLKYCYTGARKGEFHEFSVGNRCRWCKLAIGKPLDALNIEKEGAAILAAQTEELKVEITGPRFEDQSMAIRQRRIIPEKAVLPSHSWLDDLRYLATIGQRNGLTEVSARLNAVLDGADPTAKLEELARIKLWAPVSKLGDALRATVLEKIGPSESEMGKPIGRARAGEAMDALVIFDTMTEDPFIEGPRALQEYWAAKATSAGEGYEVTECDGSRWFKISEEHNERINKILVSNASWYGGMITDEMRPVLKRLGKTIGPVLNFWRERVRPAHGSMVWTTNEAQLLLRALVLEAWAQAVTEGSRGVGDWTRALSVHVKKQLVRYSAEAIKQILQQQSELERTSVVKEFEDIKDEDQRAAELVKKQFKIGRWGVGQNLQKYNPELFEFESEQRKRMGIVDAPVDPVLLAGAAAAAAQRERERRPRASAPQPQGWPRGVHLEPSAGRLRLGYPLLRRCAHLRRSGADLRLLRRESGRRHGVVRFGLSRDAPDPPSDHV